MAADGHLKKLYLLETSSVSMPWRKDLKFETQNALMIGRCTTETQKTQTSYKPNTPTPTPNKATTVHSVYVNSNPLVLGSQDIWKIGVCTEHTVLWAAQPGNASPFKWFFPLLWYAEEPLR